VTATGRGESKDATSEQPEKKKKPASRKLSWKNRAQKKRSAIAGPSPAATGIAPSSRGEHRCDKSFPSFSVDTSSINNTSESRNHALQQTQ
jgi:hypothetical protein